MGVPCFIGCLAAGRDHVPGQPDQIVNKVKAAWNKAQRPKASHKARHQHQPVVRYTHAEDAYVAHSAMHWRGDQTRPDVPASRAHAFVQPTVAIHVWQQAVIHPYGLHMHATHSKPWSLFTGMQQQLLIYRHTKSLA
jgi:hypothetical protein